MNHRLSPLPLLLLVFLSSQPVIAEPHADSVQTLQQKQDKPGERFLQEYYAEEAAEKTIVSQYNLAVRYERGDSQPQNNQKAFDLYKKSAEAGYYPSMERLGTAYEKGELGQERNRKLALNWFEKAENALTQVADNPSATASAFAASSARADAIPAYSYHYPPVTLTGTLVTAMTVTGTAYQKPISFPALQLTSPVKIVENPNDPATKTVIVSRIQLMLDHDNTFYEENKGKNIRITCRLLPKTTAHHHTPVLCAPGNDTTESNRSISE